MFLHRFATLAVIVAGSLPAPALAWGDAGHRMVCRVAWDELLEQPLANLKALLGIATEEEFAEACTWAGRYTVEHPEAAAWHEVYVPVDTRSVDLARDCPAAQSCVLREIEKNVDVLKSGAPRAERATALKFLAHFVGDVHQPLHVGFAADRGGADIAAVFLGRPTTLREIWDTALIETDTEALEQIASTYHAYTPLDRLFVDWMNALPVEWANESLWIMRTPATGYVGNPGGLAFDQVYVDQNRAVAFDRIAKAGMRLGHLLNEALR